MPWRLGGEGEGDALPPSLPPHPPRSTAAPPTEVPRPNWVAWRVLNVFWPLSAGQNMRSMYPSHRAFGAAVRTHFACVVWFFSCVSVSLVFAKTRALWERFLTAKTHKNGLRISSLGDTEAQGQVPEIPEINPGHLSQGSMTSFFEVFGSQRPPFWMPFGS